MLGILGQDRWAYWDRTDGQTETGPMLGILNAETDPMLGILNAEIDPMFGILNAETDPMLGMTGGS